jgi:serine/threonine protein kinase
MSSHKVVMILRIGDTIAGRYKIIEELEEGGFGKVFIAEDFMRFKAQCVVKQFIQSYDKHSEKGLKARALFETEARILAELESYPQVPSLLAYLEDEDCIVQELINGKNLKQELEEKGVFDENKVLELLSEILPILQEIHKKGIFHRDIKPENIIRTHKNQLVIVDFGIAKQLLDLKDFTISNSNFKVLRSTEFGTSGYQAPDSFSSPSSDLYSLGATCFHLLTGDSPSDLEWNYGDDWFEKVLTNLSSQVSKSTLSILKKMLDQTLSRRYQTADEVLQEIRGTNEAKRKQKIEFLLSLLKSSDERYISQAIYELAEFGAEANVAIPLLIDFIKDDDERFSLEVEDTLAKIGKESVPYLAELLQNEKIQIRRRAVRILAEIGSQAESAIPALIEALNDNDPQGNVRWYAVITIGEIGIAAKEAIPALIKLLKDSKSGIRAWALYALGRMGTLAKEAIPFIREMLPDEESNNVFMAGIEALDAIGHNIDEISINYPGYQVMTAREWVILVREETRKHTEAKKEALRAKGAMIYEWQRPLSSHTPPQKTLSQFMSNNSNEAEKC